MLRSLVVLFLGLNIALFFWLRANPTWGEAEREPQRLQRQVSPGAIEVLPDLPASAASVPLAAAATELSFAPPAAGVVATAAVALRRPSGATPGRGAGSR